MLFIIKCLFQRPDSTESKVFILQHVAPGSTPAPFIVLLIPTEVISKQKCRNSPRIMLGVAPNFLEKYKQKIVSSLEPKK